MKKQDSALSNTEPGRKFHFPFISKGPITDQWWKGKM